MIRILWAFAALILCTSTQVSSQTISSVNKELFISTIGRQNAWVDSVFKKLNRHDRVAQLFMIRAHTDRGKRYEDSVANIIMQERIGGLVFFQGGPERQAALTNRYQSLARTPLLVAMDGEWGVGMRLDSSISYPYQMTLGAIQDNNLIYRMGQEVAKDFKRLGIHVNFAPVVDVNNNPKNPVIGYRSFGDDKANVTAKAGAYMKGMQDEGILISLKHFPGHGDTDVDSHYDLPLLPFGRARLDSLEMYPFRELIKQNAAGVMVAHMSIPALDNTPNLPSTLSKPIVTGVLKEDLGFKGLIFSDAMEMKGVVKYFPNGEADVRAIIAGNDIVELSKNSKRANLLVRRAIHQNHLSWEQVNESVKKVLAAKYWSGLNQIHKIDTGVSEFLNRSESMSLNQQLADAALTVIKGGDVISSLELQKKTALISLGMSEISLFQNELKGSFQNSTNFTLSKIAGASDISTLLQELRSYDQIIVGIHDYRKRPASTLDYNREMSVLISELAKLTSVIVLFANPYTLAGFEDIEQSKALIVNYQNSNEAQKASAKVLSGQAAASGRLSVSINSFFKTGDGVSLPVSKK